MIDPVATLLPRLQKAAARRELIVTELGRVFDDPLLLLHPSTTSPSGGPHLLIAAGFHGDEPAGCFGLAEFLETAPDDLFRTCQLSFLPIVNPTGLRACQRENQLKQNPNAGFCHTKSGHPEVSLEGAILVENSARLCELGRDGFLTLHEDIEQTKFYAYSFEKRPDPGPFSMSFIATARRFFDVVPDGPLEGGQAKDGLLYNFCESSYEDALFHLGIPRTVCTETPGLLPLPQRVAATVALIETFCRAVLIEV